MPSIVFGNNKVKKNDLTLKKKELNGQTSECTAFLLELPGAERNGIKFQNDSQSGKSSSVSCDRHLFD